MEFKNYSFKDLLENIVDNRGKTCPVESDGMPLIATNCIKDNSLYAEYERVRYVSDETYKTWFRGHPEPEDIIFVCKGAPGRIAWVQNPVPYCIAQDMVAIRAKKSIINSKFLFALLRSQKTQKSILNMHVGTMIPHFKKGDFSNLYFDIPSDLAYQKWAGELYFSFSEKIELNKKTNQTLEQMSQALFKSWFIDFTPVFDNLLAKVDFKLENLTSDFPAVLLKKAQMRLLALDDKSKEALKFNKVQGVQSTESKTQCLEKSQVNIHKHFPSEFEHNEQLGWIPKGWELGQIDSHAKIEMGQSPKGDTYNNRGVGTPLVNGPVEFGVYFTNKSKWTTSPTKLSKKNDLIVCVRGSTTGRYVKSDGEYCLGRGVCSIRGKISQAFTDQLFKHSIREMLGLTTGSTFPNWSRQTLSQFKSIIPSTNTLKLFDKLVAANIEKIESAVIESEYLTKLRDTLLPKLISGELELPTATTQKEEEL